MSLKFKIGIPAIIATVAAGILALGVLPRGNDAGSSVKVARAIELCVAASKSEPQGRLSAPVADAEDWLTPPVSFHDWSEGTSLFAWFDEAEPVIYLATSDGDLVAVTNFTTTAAPDGAQSVTFSGPGSVLDDTAFDVWKLMFMGYAAEAEDVRETDVELTAHLDASGSRGTAELVLDGKRYSMEAKPAPRNAETAACEALQQVLARDWKGLLESFDGIDGFSEDEKDEMPGEVDGALDGEILSAVLDGPLGYNDQSLEGYPVAYGRARITIRRGGLTTDEVSDIALIYRGEWKLWGIGPPDEFEDSGMGEPVTIGPGEDGLFLYYDDFDATLLVQLDPKDPDAGRFVYKDPVDGIFWSKTPGTLSTGADGLTRLRFEGEGMRRASGYGNLDGDLFEPSDSAYDKTERNVSQPARFTIEATFREGGKSVSGSVTNEHGTKRFAFSDRRISPRPRLQRGFELLLAGDLRGFIAFSGREDDLAKLAGRLPPVDSFGSLQKSPVVTWKMTDDASMHLLVKTSFGYAFLTLSAHWDGEKDEWLVGVNTSTDALRPKVCVQREADGSLTAVFGYSNPWHTPLTIKAGSPGNDMKSRTPVEFPETFEPGTHDRIATAPLSSEGMSWQLNGIVAPAHPRSALPQGRTC